MNLIVRFQTVRNIITWFDPKMSNYTIDSEKEYGVNCWDITFERIWSHLDWFAFGHYWGWGMKALIIRHYGICWSVSIMWELTEVISLTNWSITFYFNVSTVFK
jgi:phosphatidylserine synthase 1